MDTNDRQRPPVDSSADESQMTKAAMDTAVVLDAGILPHSTKERDHARELLKPAYNIQGGKLYVEGIARLNNPHVIIDSPPDISLRGQLSLPDHQKEQKRQEIAKEIQDAAVTKVADHMMDYVEDAKKTIDALTYLKDMIGSFDEKLLFSLLVPTPSLEARRSIATLTRMYETKEYVQQAGPTRTRMNNDLMVEGDDQVDERIKEATDDQTVGAIKIEIAEALALETGRLNFWSDQLIGRRELSARSEQRDELDVLTKPARPAIRKRYGVIELDNPKLRTRVLKRMSSIAVGQYSEETSVQNEK
jgi:hypothetical protein